MRDWGAKKHLTLAQQHLFLRSNVNAEGDGYIKGGKLVWRFTAKPTPISRSYIVRIEYTAQGIPDVYVEDPDLMVLSCGRELPHIYDAPTRLCLYMPLTGQWSATKRLDQTIVPWSYIWLFYFEEWLASDEWKGGGKHPSDDDPEPSQNRRARRLFARN